jgi:hypothetical protein
MCRSRSVGHKANIDRLPALVTDLVDLPDRNRLPAHDVGRRISDGSQSRLEDRPSWPTNIWLI